MVIYSELQCPETIQTLQFKSLFSKSNISLSQYIIIHYRGIIIYSISSTNNKHNILKLFQIYLEEKRHWPRLS